MAKPKKATKEVVEQTTEQTTESINVDNPVDLGQVPEQAATPTETAEPELTSLEEEQVEPDKVSEVMDHELTETEQEEKQEEKQEQNEEKPEQNEPEQEEQEEPKVGFEK